MSAASPRHLGFDHSDNDDDDSDVFGHVDRCVEIPKDEQSDDTDSDFQTSTLLNNLVTIDDLMTFLLSTRSWPI